jgi:hypothetical protein
MDLSLTEPSREQTRARRPDSSGHVERDGVQRYYDVYGVGEPISLPDAGDSGHRRRDHGPGQQIALAEATGGGSFALQGSGYGSHVREPVQVNLLPRDLAIPAPTRPRWVRGRSRPKRVLHYCSPIGLSHAQRDAAIAGELRNIHPGLPIDWLAQHPVTAALEARGERVHPASAHLASESRAHRENESAEHDLRAFRAIRRMDEILLANFMVLHGLAAERRTTTCGSGMRHGPERRDELLAPAATRKSARRPGTSHVGQWRTRE